jgi:hypothetical protein
LSACVTNRSHSRGNPRFDSIFYHNAPVLKRTLSLLGLVSKMISLHSYLVYTYEQQIFIDEIDVYSRRHIQLSSTRGHSGGQPSIFCFKVPKIFPTNHIARNKICSVDLLNGHEWRKVGCVVENKHQFRQ